MTFLCVPFQLAKRNVTDKQWVASEAWVTARLLTSPHFHPLLEGTLGFSFPGVRIPGLKEFLLSVRPSSKPGMEFVNMFWEELFGCRLEIAGAARFQENEAVEDTAAERPVCTGLEDLASTDSGYTDVSKVRISYNVYKAVYSVAHALHTLLNCGPTGHNKGMCEKHKPFTSRQVNSHCKMSKSSFM